MSRGTVIAESSKLLGLSVEDKVTGVIGMVDSISFDVYGCVMATVKQRVQDDGKVPASSWFDVKRLKLLEGPTRVMPVPEFATTVMGHEIGAAEKPIDARHL